jgi:hypothetical protein
LKARTPTDKLSRCLSPLLIFANTSMSESHLDDVSHNDIDSHIILAHGDNESTNIAVTTVQPSTAASHEEHVTSPTNIAHQPTERNDPVTDTTDCNSSGNSSSNSNSSNSNNDSSSSSSHSNQVQSLEEEHANDTRTQEVDPPIALTNSSVNITQSNDTLGADEHDTQNPIVKEDTMDVSYTESLQATATDPVCDSCAPHSPADRPLHIQATASELLHNEIAESTNDGSALTLECPETVSSVEPAHIDLVDTHESLQPKPLNEVVSVHPIVASSHVTHEHDTDTLNAIEISENLSAAPNAGDSQAYDDEVTLEMQQPNAVNDADSPPKLQEEQAADATNMEITTSHLPMQTSSESGSTSSTVDSPATVQENDDGNAKEREENNERMNFTELSVKTESPTVPTRDLSENATANEGNESTHSVGSPDSLEESKDGGDKLVEILTTTETIGLAESEPVSTEVQVPSDYVSTTEDNTMPFSNDLPMLEQNINDKSDSHKGVLEGVTEAASSEINIASATVTEEAFPNATTNSDDVSNNLQTPGGKDDNERKTIDEEMKDVIVVGATETDISIIPSDHAVLKTDNDNAPLLINPSILVEKMENATEARDDKIKCLDSASVTAHSITTANKAAAAVAAATAATFVNTGLEKWEAARYHWLAHNRENNTSPRTNLKFHARTLDVDEIIDILFASPRSQAQQQQQQKGDGPQPFPQPVPLPQMVDILQDLWEAEGLDI